ncbi:MAG: 1-deoxy-D-xylulose-5-phosphate reductoisomerase [Alphaproteobacteria bacterium]|nr:1-deoxy-D-xylulose-5-phosphate reductoisomerase [Alphaproteobacteria bacterium]
MSSDNKKIISVFGVTGSVGQSTLEILKLNVQNFIVDTLVSNNNVQGLVQAAKLLKPSLVIINNNEKFIELKNALKDYDITIASGTEAIIDASKRNVDILVAGISGFAGLNSTINAIGSANIIALANKESIVCAGPILLNKAKKSNSKIIPVDSEHNTLFQILKDTDIDDVSKLIITGSGGPFRGFSLKQLERVTLEDAINHPIWNMGKKISIDSATLMNKGLELIEASYLFEIDQNKIEIIIHPESMIHGIVEYKDGTMNAGISMPDMKYPISYALNFPNKANLNFKRLNLALVGSLNFEEVNKSVFKSIAISRYALKEGHTFVISLNAINEIAVEYFIKRNIKFTSIINILEEAMSKIIANKIFTLEDIVMTDKEARSITRQIINIGNF